MAGTGGVNFDTLARRTLGDTAFASDLLGLFRTHAPPLFERLKSAGSKRTDAAAAAHRLKGSAGTIAAVHLAGLIARLETQWADGDEAAAAESITAIETELSVCLDQIETRLAGE